MGLLVFWLVAYDQAVNLMLYSESIQGLGKNGCCEKINHRKAYSSPL